MLKTNSKILAASIAFSCTLGFNCSVSAHTADITNLTEFYEYYGFDFDDDQKVIIEGIFSNIEDYLGPNGVQEAILDGYIPLTPEWIDHGVHWFNYNPEYIDITNMQANPFKPAGLNIGVNGELLGVFWASELYDPIVPVFQQLQQSGALNSLTPEQLTELYTQHKAITEKPTPTIFDIFPDAQWHQHKDVLIENLYAVDEDGNLDPQQVDFQQSYDDATFIAEILRSLGDPDSILFPLESPSNSFPPFNRGVSAGFHMIHMWVGQGNHAGLFAGTNQDIDHSEEAIFESTTFQDGSGGHDHNPDDDHNGGHSPSDPTNPNPTQTVPEPSSLISVLLLFFLGLLKVKN